MHSGRDWCWLLGRRLSMMTRVVNLLRPRTRGKAGGRTVMEARRLRNVMEAMLRRTIETKLRIEARARRRIVAEARRRNIDRGRLRTIRQVRRRGRINVEARLDRTPEERLSRLTNGTRVSKVLGLVREVLSRGREVLGRVRTLEGLRDWWLSPLGTYLCVDANR